MTRIEPGYILDGRYQLDRVVGRGGFGEVWRAIDVRLPPRAVAVKFMRHAQTSTDLVRRFRIEARTLSTLNHPNIVAIVDQGTEEDHDYFVMEFLAGQSLAAWLDEHRTRGAWPDYASALEIFAQVVAAVEAAHSLTEPGPIIHRDLKPGNVFLVSGSRAEDIHAKVVDFGLAQFGGRTVKWTPFSRPGRSLRFEAAPV